MKKLILSTLTAALLMTPISYAQVKKVSISQLVEHPALDSARKGVIEALAEAGFKDGDNLKIDFQNAQGNPTTATQIAKKFAGDKPDVVVAIATPSAQAAAGAIKDIPIVFTAVSDPISAKLMTNMAHPNGNVTGITDNPAMEPQLDLILELLPQAKNIGVIYSPGEANSVAMIAIFKDIATARGLHIVEAPATKTADVTTAARSLAGKVDVIYVPLDNTVVSAFESVAVVAKASKIPLVAADTGSAVRGASAALGFDYFQLGKETGVVVAGLLNGQKVADFPAKGVDKLDLFINLKAATEQGLTIPQAVIDRAQKIIQ